MDILFLVMALNYGSPLVPVKIISKTVITDSQSVITDSQSVTTHSQSVITDLQSVITDHRNPLLRISNPLLRVRINPLLRIHNLDRESVRRLLGILDPTELSVSNIV